MSVFTSGEDLRELALRVCRCLSLVLCCQLLHRLDCGVLKLLEEKSSSYLVVFR